jgi:PhnB protein
MPAQTIVPYLTVKDAAAAIDFYKKAFGATEVSRAAAQDGKRLVHADLSINGGSVFLMDEFPEHGEGAATAPNGKQFAPVSMVVNYDAPAQVDAAYRRAVDAGCAGMQEPHDAFWNSRFAMLRDPYGHGWMLNAPLSASRG